MRRARPLLDGLRRALRGTTQRPGAAALSVGTIAASLLVVGVLALTTLNVGRLADGWGRGIQLVVYMEDGTPPERAHAIGRVLAGVPAVERVDYVPPEEAYARLGRVLGARRDLLDEVEVGTLPASLEVALAPGARDLAAVGPLASRLRAIPGVEDVEVPGDWVDRLTSLLAALRLAAWAVALLGAAACIYVVASTMQLAIADRRHELELLRLLGATTTWIRLPLVAEGALQGALGAAAAAALLGLLHRLGAPLVERGLEAALGSPGLVFLPASWIATGVVAGALLGATGSGLAVVRHARP